MSTKKTDVTPVNSNINTNNNTNNVNVNVKVEQPKTARKKNPPKKAKSNWLMRTVIIGVIGLALSIVGYYLTKDDHNKPMGVDNGSPAISGHREN